MLPAVSVIMPVFNCQEFVSEAVQSILKQSFQNFELIIIDDASTDDTARIIRAIDDPRIKLVEKEINTGYTNSLNMGIKLSEGKYLARMDGDDISLPERFATQVNYLDKHDDVAVCGTWYQYLATDEIIKHPADPGEVKLALLEHSALGHPTVMLRKSIIDRHNLWYDVNMEPSEDYDLWVRILKYGKIVNVPEVHLKYRLHPHQVSNTRDKLQDEHAIKARKKLIGYLYDELPKIDVTQEIKFSGDISANRMRLLQFLQEVKKVKNLNKEKNVFPIAGFARFLETRKRIVIQSYFKHPRSCGWKNLFFFLFSKNTFYRKFNNRDKIRIIIKNLFVQGDNNWSVSVRGAN